MVTKFSHASNQDSNPSTDGMIRSFPVLFMMNGGRERERNSKTELRGKRDNKGKGQEDEEERVRGVERGVSYVVEGNKEIE